MELNAEKMKLRLTLAILLAFLLLLGLTACGNGTKGLPETPPPVTEVPTPSPTPKPTPTPQPTPEPTPTPTPEPTPEPEPEFRNYLNGTPLEEEDRTRPFALMVNNHPEAQPQCGIGNADIIYEVLAEGNITRMMCLFSHIRDAGELGSIRSVRPYYQDICFSYGAVLCHAGGSEDAYDRIRNLGIQNIDGVRGWYTNEPFWRDKDRRSAGYALEHTLFTSGEKLWEAAELMKYPLEVGEDYDCGLYFVNDWDPLEGEDAATIDINFNKKTTKLVYHSETGCYTGYQLNADYADGLTGEMPQFRNVFILYADIRTYDSYGRLKVDLVTESTGWYARDGKVIPITWSKAGTYEPFHYFTEDGEDLTVRAGKTYIAIVSPSFGEVSFSG